MRHSDHRSLGTSGVPIALLAAMVAACMGSIGDPAAGPPVRDSEANRSVPSVIAEGRPGATAGSPGALPGGGVATRRVVGPSHAVRLLTREEYDNTVRDLLGESSRPAEVLPSDEIFLGVALGGTVSELKVEAFHNIAVGIATRAASRLPSLLPCASGSVDPAVCAHMFIAKLGRRAFRRPLSADESRRLVALFDASAAVDGFSSAIQLVIEAVLQSPNFLYVVELGAASGENGEAVRLTDHELATRLSYFLWGSLPDADLDSLADRQALSDGRELEKQARRLLADRRAQDSVRALFRDWLGLEELRAVTKDATVFRDFTESMATSMQEETERLIADIFAGSATLKALLTASTSFVNKDLAKLYGVPAPLRDWDRVALDPAQRAGLLTQPSLLAKNAHPNHTSPVRRGHFVREALLCSPPPPPPPDIPIKAPEPDPKASMRERYQQHSQDPACSGCHALMDPIGFGFESYDAIGRFRLTENGKPIDASGTIAGTQDLNGPFRGPVELAARLVASAQVADCVARHWFHYSLKRGEDGDARSLQAALDAFRRSNGELRELAAALVLSDAFRFRQPSL